MLTSIRLNEGFLFSLPSLKELTFRQSKNVPTFSIKAAVSMVLLPLVKYRACATLPLIYPVT